MESYTCSLAYYKLTALWGSSSFNCLLYFSGTTMSPPSTSVKLLEDTEGPAVELLLGIQEEGCHIDGVYFPTRRAISTKLAGKLYQYLDKNCVLFHPILTNRPQTFKLKQSAQFQVDQAELESIISNNADDRPLFNTKDTSYYPPTKIQVISPKMVRLQLGVARETIHPFGTGSFLNAVELCIKVKESTVRTLHAILSARVKAFNVELKTGWQYLKLKDDCDSAQIVDMIKKLEGADFTII